jgi:hypothetical protein
MREIAAQHPAPPPKCIRCGKTLDEADGYFGLTLEIWFQRDRRRGTVNAERTGPACGDCQFDAWDMWDEFLNNSEPETTERKT